MSISRGSIRARGRGGRSSVLSGRSELDPSFRRGCDPEQLFQCRHKADIFLVRYEIARAMMNAAAAASPPINVV
jgi:hypothetical protein